ncbi:hypothetical protein [Brevibacillus massiliensis]|uniref:hypothetical protein n=1 Tax=Brevibacillus massiliensis TaxID=1118054 RepID=UPI00035E36FE|nr:hypothetical protein [Brevibacillus massiliensis]
MINDQDNFTNNNKFLREIILNLPAAEQQKFYNEMRGIDNASNTNQERIAPADASDRILRWIRVAEAYLIERQVAITVTEHAAKRAYEYGIEAAFWARTVLTGERYYDVV